MATKDIALRIGGSIFSIVTLLHFHRTITGPSVIISGWDVPVWLHRNNLTIHNGKQADKKELTIDNGKLKTKKTFTFPYSPIAIRQSLFANR